MPRARSVLLVAALAGVPACGRSVDPAAPPAASSVPTTQGPPSSSAPAPAPQASLPKPRSSCLDLAAYPWLADSSIVSPAPVDCLEDRFPAPAGHSRVALEPGTFGSWLRKLPLAAPGTLVRSHLGAALYEPDHPNIAAVVAIDPGTADLQQCADSVMRLYSEWLWSTGKREMTWRAAAGTMPYDRWVQGDRPVAKGPALIWEPGSKGRPRDDHASFRKYLDAVFMFANTGSLAQQAKPVAAAELSAGDFVVMPGSPGHAVLVLDVAITPAGSKLALLGQGYMPAQNFQVLRESPSQTWFAIDPSAAGLKTPFWRLFPWNLLRRL
jgi:hypothetical protein